MKALKEMAAKIKMRQRMLDMLYNKKLYICKDIVDIIVKRAADDLFNTPVASRIPTDSFASDYELEQMKIVEADLNLGTLDDINRTTDMTGMSDKGHAKKSKGKKHKHNSP